MATECVDHGRGSRDIYAVLIDGAYQRGELPAGLHRRVFLHYNGYLPEVVMHSCDNKRCINPEHLLPGTLALNNKDMSAKGRCAKAYKTKRVFTPEQIVNIRMQKAEGASYSRLAEEFGVAIGTLQQIIYRKSYAEI